MKVILQKNVPGLGDLGDIKEVANGYARNYLLPHKLVVSAHTGTKRALLHQKRALEVKIHKRKKSMGAFSMKLKELPALEIEARVGKEGKLFGSVTSMHICRALSQEGFTIDRRKIEIRDSIRTVGTHSFRVNLTDGIHVSLFLKVTPDEDSIKREEERKASEEKKMERKAKEASPSSEENPIENPIENPTKEPLAGESGPGPLPEKEKPANHDESLEAPSSVSSGETESKAREEKAE